MKTSFSLGYLCFLLLLPGCTSTVTPRVVAGGQASWDGNAQNSGFLGWTPAGFGMVTPRARERYNALVARYGTKFAPPLNADQGLWDTGTNVWLIQEGALEHFATMNRWRREGR